MRARTARAQERRKEPPAAAGRAPEPNQIHERERRRNPIWDGHCQQVHRGGQGHQRRKHEDKQGLQKRWAHCRQSIRQRGIEKSLIARLAPAGGHSAKLSVIAFERVNGDHCKMTCSYQAYHRRAENRCAQLKRERGDLGWRRTATDGDFQRASAQMKSLRGSGSPRDSADFA